MRSSGYKNELREKKKEVNKTKLEKKDELKRNELNKEELGGRMSSKRRRH